MAVLRIFIIACVAIAFVWICLQFVLLNSCLTVNDPVPSDIHLICQREQSLLMLHSFNLAKNKPECFQILKEAKNSVNLHENMPIIYIITPTYKRPVQKAELTRLSYTLLLVPNIYWIVVEDADNKTDLVTNFLHHCGIQYAHLNVPTPPQLKLASKEPTWRKARGVLQRNKGLSWLRQHLDINSDRGVVYFADDDNTYDIKLFDEMRFTKTVSVWPVGLVGGLLVERPLVEGGKVVGWNTLWKADRPFPIDMAGFAVNLTLLLQHSKAAFSLRVPIGYQESNLLKDVVTASELEPKADNCTKVLVWHTRTEKPNLSQEKKLTVSSNVNIEV